MIAAVRPDAVCAAAVELARAAAVEVGGDQVGDHLGISADAERLVTHRFAAVLPGYRGWHWAVTVARASRARVATVDEVVLLPGEGSLMAPEWVPWAERLQAGDLSAGDLLPAEPDDPRLVPGYILTGDPATDDVAQELGLGRPRVLSPDGRLEAAQRWYDGDGGPDTAIARHAPAHCGTCGFLVRLAGSLQGAFGVCANEYSPSDANVVAVDHGCGAHSDAAVVPLGLSAPSGVIYDDGAIEIEVTNPAAMDASSSAETAQTAVPAREQQAAQPE